MVLGSAFQSALAALQAGGIPWWVWLIAVLALILIVVWLTQRRPADSGAAAVAPPESLPRPAEPAAPAIVESPPPPAMPAAEAPALRPTLPEIPAAPVAASVGALAPEPEPEPPAPAMAARPAPEPAAPPAMAAPESPEPALAEPAPAPAEVAPQPAAPPAAPAAAAPAQPARDDLERIEGIGPVIAKALNAAGINTYQQLADTNTDQIKETLRAAGIRIGDPGTWPQQAKLAAAGDWKKLQRLQDRLVGGRKA